MTAARDFIDSLPTRDTTPPGVTAVEDYTFDQLLTHLHDYHGRTAENMVEDEESNGTEQEVIDMIRSMTREEAIARIPFHYFQVWGTADSLESAVLTHAQDHADYYGGGGLVHFHPGKDLTA